MFLLGVAPHHKRDGFGEFEHGADVERGKFLRVELEGNGEDTSIRCPAVVDVAQHVEAARVLKHGKVRIDSLFGVRVKPEKWRNPGKMLESIENT
jgi:hypothetical protein